MDTYTRDGLTFDVTDSGAQDAPVIVLLHGFPQDRQAWEKVAPQLVEAGYRVLAPDQRGYSPGATPRSRTAYPLSELARDVIALIDAAGAPTAHVVGHDWGGAVIWQLAQAHPNRIASATTLSTPHPEALMWAMRHSNQWRKSSYMAFFQLPWIAERGVLRQLPEMYVKTGMSPEDAQKYADRFATPRSLSGPLGWYRSMLAGQLRAALPSRKQASGPRRARKVTVPMSYVWGSRDFALGREAAEKSAEFVSGPYEFVEVKGAGHWLPEVNADEVVEAVLRRVR
ncbi:alpha/beta hydrolase [Flexivirga endophytica]|uniref:Alpha/beta hydrolase n=1 Tax=Flexivirga endophytica TaxID=1849103 RepID=A0A916T362_9MICO|nr:alpha/beta hydrolase [Flexivirga endophytica]GGB27031.1 alpha/beta hydrolase [Flexivirga endophytica]GHB55511.1 alpha/beta hydrolase [Flexivirga endophytica]